jgi:hypothetical protein
MKKHLFVFLLVCMVFGKEKINLEQNKSLWQQSLEKLSNNRVILKDFHNDIKSTTTTLQKLGDEIEIQIANNASQNILYITDNITSMNSHFYIFKEIADVHISTDEALCIDSIEDILKRTLPAMEHQMKDFIEDINAGIQLLNGLATISKNIQLVTTMNDVKKIYRAMLNVM